MKKLKLVFIGLFLILTFNGFANDSKVNFHWGIGTAGILYGDDSTKELTKTLTNDEFSRMILSGELGFSIKLDKSIRFVTGGNISYDLFMKNSQNASFLDYAFFGGLRVYPNLGGFNVGLEYNIGQRANFYNLVDYEATSGLTNWGNGFRFVTEFDFSYYTEGLAPVVGLSYRRMPRGGFADNFFSFYFRFTY